MLSHLNYDLPVLRLTDSVAKALKTLRAQGVNALAVAENKQYIGLVSLEILSQALSPEQFLSDLKNHFSSFKMEEEEDVLASLPWFDEPSCDIIAITNADNQFRGYLTKTEVGNLLLNSGVENKNGGIIRIPFQASRDSLSTIIRIIEEENGFVVRSFFQEPNVVLQVQTETFGKIISNLERHSIFIEKAFVFGEQLEVDQDRFDHLMRFIDL
ncbi:CBS domain-containing protein [Aquirufa sp. KTFRIE-69F]|uniref:CBS domain-containing protein n=1 Tax=Aquirufa originis TaxID=3096514 RepID=A0ABW6D4D5_9BACT